MYLPKDLRCVNLAFGDAWGSLGHVSNWLLAYSWESFDRAKARICHLYPFMKSQFAIIPRPLVRNRKTRKQIVQRSTHEGLRFTQHVFLLWWKVMFFSLTIFLFHFKFSHLGISCLQEREWESGFKKRAEQFIWEELSLMWVENSKSNKRLVAGSNLRSSWVFFVCLFLLTKKAL